MHNFTLYFNKSKRIRPLFYISIVLLILYLCLSIYGLYIDHALLLWISIALIIKGFGMMYFYGRQLSSSKPYIIYEDGIMTLKRIFGKKQSISLNHVNYAKFIGRDLIIETDQKKILKISLDYLSNEDRNLLENTFKDLFL